MKQLKNLLIVICLIEYFNLVHSNIFNKVKCYFYECCDEPYLIRDFVGLETKLKKNLFGQPLVISTTVNALRAHFELGDQPKPLVLSFHGLTGSGKNYVTKFIAESLFLYGFNSKFYKYFSATRDFPHNNKLQDYKEKIINEIETTVQKKCAYSLFIFDEMDKIPIGLMDPIKNYLESTTNIEGTDYRKSIFIFLSNSASKEIDQKTFELESNNMSRDKFELKAFQKLIQDSFFREKNNDGKGMWHASLIANHVIDHYVPFLPLLRSHVKKCIAVDLQKYGYSKKNYPNFDECVDKITDNVNFEPPGFHLYSTSGCKRISQLVRLWVIENKNANGEKSEL